MFGSNKYDIGGASFVQKLESMTDDYKAMVNRAEDVHRENNGIPTSKEAKLYNEAIKICENILSFTIEQPALRRQWESRMRECEEKVNEILDILDPKPVPEEREPQKQPVSGGKKDSKAVKKTSDKGFTTQFASKEVPVEMIESWFEDIPEVNFKDHIIGKDNLKERLLMEAGSIGWDKTDAALTIDSVQCYFFYGPPGTGKTFMIEAFVNELRKRYKDTKFNFMHLQGSEVHASYVGVAEKIVTAAFNVAVEKEPCLIFMDEIDNLCVKKTGGKTEGHEKRLTTAFMEAYNKFKKSKKRVVFIGATNHPGQVEEAMLDRVTLIKIPLPDKKERTAFFTRMIMDTKTKQKKLAIEEGLTPEEMATATRNHSYRDLERVRDYMLKAMKWEGMEKFGVRDEAGEYVQPDSDEAVFKAIAEGEIKITRALFEKAQRENIPSDKTDSRVELKEFEKNIKRSG